MILETERLILRPYRLADASSVHHYGSDPEVCRYTDFGPNTWDETLGFLQHATDPAQPNVDCAITLRDADEVVGGVGARIKPQGVYELGWVLRRDLWGRGIATEAARALTDHLLGLPGTTLILARCRPENLASARVMEKLGLTFIDLIKDDYEVRGSLVDSRLYACAAKPSASPSAHSV